MTKWGLLRAKPGIGIAVVVRIDALLELVYRARRLSVEVNEEDDANHCTEGWSRRTVRVNRAYEGL